MTTARELWQATNANQALLAMVTAALLTLALGALLLPMLRRLKVGQTVRAEGPSSHLGKAGTPTMGGVSFLLAAAAVTLWLAPRQGPAALAVFTALGVALGNGLVGFIDDYLKVVLRRPLGLRAREKLLSQVALAGFLVYVAQAHLGLGTALAVPFWPGDIELGLFYYPFVVLVVVLGTTNAVNLTDGLDGLLAGAAAVVFGFYGVALSWLGHPGLAVFCFALAGGTLAFLRFNGHPARVFMGDVGSLGLGGALAAVAVLSRTELLLPLAGGLFVLEALSVIIQVFWFRLTGRRIFRMSPIHHHFELLGWSETLVVRRFWLVAVAGALLSWYGLAGLEPGP